MSSQSSWKHQIKRTPTESKMKLIVIVLFFLFFVLSTGHNMTCYKCHARNAMECKGEEGQCPEGSSCMTVSEEFGCNETYYSIEKRCSMNLPCDTGMYAYVNSSIFYSLSYQCCKGDLCNNGTLHTPNKTYAFNGPKCPICASFDILEKCKPVGSTICRSETDQCAYLVGWVNKPDGSKSKVSLRGCMSGLSCEYDYTQAVGYSMDKILEMKCYIPKPESYQNMKTPEE